MSLAIARFEYSSWARAKAGKPLCPYPPRSPQTTVKCWARRVATRRHIKWVCGKPWSSNSGGPAPAQRTNMLASPDPTSAAPRTLAPLPTVGSGIW